MFLKSQNYLFVITMIIVSLFIVSCGVELPSSSTSSSNGSDTGATTTSTITAQGWIGSGNSGWQTTGTASSGNGLAYFNSPYSVSVDTSGNIYVADYVNKRISKWNSSGLFQGWIGGGKSGWQTSGSASSGLEYAYFYYPHSVCVDTSGNIYVADTGLNRICKWNSSGVAQGWIGCGNSGWQTSNSITSGNGLAYFNSPYSVNVDASGNIYVADVNNNRICKWNSSGVAQGWIGGGNSGWQTSDTVSSGSGLAYFNQPFAVCVDVSGNIYVSDYGNNRICKWNSSGVVQGWIGCGYSGWQTSGTVSSGSGSAYFNQPREITVDSSGNIYVADYNNARICKWNNMGESQGWIGGGNSGWQTSGPISSGSGLTYFDSPVSVYVDSSGNIFVVDGANNRICKWK
jgi:sugar lactone lactonase YvrE